MRRLMVVMALLFVGSAMAADLIGTWPYDNDAHKGQKSGSGPYVKLFGSTNSPSSFGSDKAIATLQFWDAAALCATDTTANDSTGTLNMADWLGKGATVKWGYTSAAHANLGTFTLTWQTKYSDYDSWITVKTLIDGDSITEGATIDSIDFSDPAMSAPYGRLYVDFNPTGSSQNSSDVLFSAVAKFFHTPAIKDY